MFEIITTANEERGSDGLSTLTRTDAREKIAALISYCALDCLIKKSARIRKSSIGLVRVSLNCYRKARTSAFRGRPFRGPYLALVH